MIMRHPLRCATLCAVGVIGLFSIAMVYPAANVEYLHLIYLSVLLTVIGVLSANRYLDERPEAIAAQNAINVGI